MPIARPILAAVSLAALGALAACGKAEPIEGQPATCTVVPTPLTGTGQSGVTCPGASTLRFQGGSAPADFGQGFTSTYCTRCHATTAVGDARQGATPSANWDDVCSIRAHLLVIDQRAGPVAIGRSTRMPPPALSVGFPQPTDQDRARLSEWISCGAP